MSVTILHTVISPEIVLRAGTRDSPQITLPFAASGGSGVWAPHFFQSKEYSGISTPEAILKCREPCLYRLARDESVSLDLRPGDLPCISRVRETVMGKSQQQGPRQALLDWEMGPVGNLHPLLVQHHVIEQRGQTRQSSEGTRVSATPLSPTVLTHGPRPAYCPHVPPLPQLQIWHDCSACFRPSPPFFG